MTETYRKRDTSAMDIKEKEDCDLGAKWSEREEEMCLKSLWVVELKELSVKLEGGVAGVGSVTLVCKQIKVITVRWPFKDITEFVNQMVKYRRKNRLKQGIQNKFGLG